jgi:5-methyltetrahydrofolate--homocysteine methyltransferase
MTSMTDRLTTLFDEGVPILADGAMGTMLFEAGLQFGDPPEVWNLAHPDVVRGIHRGYLEAGSRILLTNTFGGNRFRLGLSGHEDRVDELNRTAAILLRAEVDAAGDGAVAGDIRPAARSCPPGTSSTTRPSPAGRAGGPLAAGGVCRIETMSDLPRSRPPRVRPPTRLPIIATMTFDTRGHTMMGVSPERAAAALAELGVQAFGGNCGNGPDELTPVIAKMHAAQPDARLVAKSNTGMPELVDGRAVYLAKPAIMAGCALEMRAAGASIIGACCGSTPAHLRAMAEALA